MADKTEDKILDAALNLFAEHGYKGATTRAIAAEAGFNELTLFRKFKTKENLFNRVLITRQDIIIKDFNSIFSDNPPQNPREFLENVIWNLVELTDKNFQYVNLFLNEKNKVTESVIEKFIEHLGNYIENNINNPKIDYSVMAFSIFSFVFFVIYDKKHGRTFFDHKQTVEKFIDHCTLLVQS